MNLADLKTYIDDNIQNLNELSTAKEEDRVEILYETYANFLDLSSDIKHILRELRTKFSIRDAAVKKWMREQPDHSNDEATDGDEQNTEEEVKEEAKVEASIPNVEAPAQVAEPKPVAKKVKVAKVVAKGKKLAAFGLTEANAGSDAGAMQTTARQDGDYYVLKMMIYKKYQSAFPFGSTMAFQPRYHPYARRQRECS
jgi:hypothetical protein